MKIISRYTDYYDWVATQHGGGDPKLPYLRELILPTKLPNGQQVEQAFTVPAEMYARFPLRDKGNHMSRGISTSYKLLCVCGKVYLLVKRESWNTHPIVDREERMAQPGCHDWRMALDAKEFYHGLATEPFRSGKHDDPVYTELAKLVGAPVFCIEGREVDGRVPHLKLLGFDQLVEAQQLYQEISYFLGNVIRQEHAIIEAKPSDVDKALSHGFDKKVSFRHRK